MKTKPRGLLVGTRRIREYCGIGVSTFYRWVDLYQFPVVRFPNENGTGGLWVSSPSLIEQWLKGHMEQERSEVPNPLPATTNSP